MAKYNFTKEDVLRMVADHDDNGKSYDAISKLYGCSKTHARALCAGIKGPLVRDKSKTVLKCESLRPPKDGGGGFMATTSRIGAMK